MREGAFGLSTGLEYETGKAATTEEVIALASIAGVTAESTSAIFGTRPTRRSKLCVKRFGLAAKVVCPFRSPI